MAQIEITLYPNIVGGTIGLPAPTGIPAVSITGLMQVLRGAAGLPGIDGPTGLTGLTGPTGTAGATGPTGLTGLTGPAGPQGGVGTSGTATLNFGLSGDDQADVTVLLASLSATSKVLVWLSPQGTLDNDADEHFAEPAQPRVTSISPGLSFVISMVSTDHSRLFGTWLVNWVVV